MAGVGLHVDSSLVQQELVYLSPKPSRRLSTKMGEKNLDGQQQTELDEVYPD
jgi:hypothetical protein